jgi:hypothetical protein
MQKTNQQYELQVKGHLGDTFLAAFPELESERRGPDTVLTGHLPDSSAVYGVVVRLESLGLDLIELHCRQAQDGPDPNAHRLGPDDAAAELTIDAASIATPCITKIR